MNNSNSRFLPFTGPVLSSVHMQYGQIKYSSAPNSLNGLPKAYVGYAVDRLSHCATSRKVNLQYSYHCDVSERYPACTFFNEAYCDVARS